jgi:hypothetical protein
MAKRTEAVLHRDEEHQPSARMTDPVSVGKRYYLRKNDRPGGFGIRRALPAGYISVAEKGENRTGPFFVKLLSYSCKS